VAAVDCQTNRVRIDRAFVRGGSLRSWREIQSHLEYCEECSRYYDRVALATRALGATDSGLAKDASEMIALDLVDRFQSRSGLRWFPGARTLVPAVAGLIVFLVAGGSLIRSRASEFQARGGGSNSRGEVRAFCLNSAGGVLGTTGSRGTLRCPLDGTLQFSYSAPLSGVGYLAVFGVDSSGRALPYHASPGEAASVAVHSGAVEEPLGHSVRLAVNHHPGLVHVVALFSKTQLNSENGERFARSIAATGTIPAELESAETLTLEVNP
jgi:hypothetical protein